MLRRYIFLLIPLLAALSCAKEQRGGETGAPVAERLPMAFTAAVASPSTKSVTEVTTGTLGSTIYVTAVKSDGSFYFVQEPFTLGASGRYVNASCFWPVGEDLRFLATNCDLDPDEDVPTTGDIQYEISSDTDYVFAATASTAISHVIPLTFSHALSWLYAIELSPTEGVTATVNNLEIDYWDTGSYAVGAGLWEGLSTDTIDLSGGLSTTTDMLVFPGIVTLTIDYTATFEGETADYVKKGYVSMEAGKKVTVSAELGADASSLHIVSTALPWEISSSSQTY